MNTPNLWNGAHSLVVGICDTVGEDRLLPARGLVCSAGGLRSAVPAERQIDWLTELMWKFATRSGGIFTNV